LDIFKLLVKPLKRFIQTILLFSLEIIKWGQMGNYFPLIIYNMSYPTYSIDNGVGITDITGDIQIGVGVNGLSITSGLLTTPSTTVINQSGFTTGANNFPFNALYQLNQALEALEPAPNTTTVQFNNSILLQDPLVPTDGITINNNSITALTSLSTTSATDIFDTASSGAIFLTAQTNVNLTSNGFGSVQSVSSNFNNNGFAMPICFTRERADTFTYNFNGTGVPQTLEQVYTTSFNIPQAFVSDTPLAGYTSSIWKVDFALNTWNNSVVNDKGIALYFTLQDATATFNMSPQTYSANTPYAVYQPASTYIAGGGNTAFQNYNWSDWIDLSPLSGQGSGVLPLNLLLNFAGDNAFTCNFQMTLTLTRTNLI
jgi:hypothetical protein